MSIEKLFEGQELSDDFKNEAKVIFEAAVSEKVETLREEFQTQLNEETENKVSQYCDYVAEEFIKENRLVIEAEQKVEFAEKIITKFREILEEVGVEIPETKVDAYENLKEKYEGLKTKLDASIVENIRLADTINLLKADNVIDNVSEDLTLTQKEKLKSLIEHLVFESAEQFEKDVKIVKNKFFTESKSNKDEDEIMTESKKETVKSLKLNLI
jgi:hypothetical protein